MALNIMENKVDKKPAIFVFILALSFLLLLGPLKSVITLKPFKKGCNCPTAAELSKSRPEFYQVPKHVAESSRTAALNAQLRKSE